jgi:capsular polysaccharide biosynthesis protein
MLRALLRFWWVAIVGIVLAGVVFVVATYKVELGVPPKLTARATSTYTSSTQLLITSKHEPYLSSTNVNAQTIKLGTTSLTDTSGNTTVQQAKTYDSGSGADGDLQRLAEIANSLPPRVTSDTVIRLRNKTFGRIDGTVNAVNPYAFSGAGGFREGPLPFIKITGTANSPEDAIDITNQTALAFKQWYVERQDADNIKLANRVLVEQVNTAAAAVSNGGAKPLLGVAAAFLVLLGAAGFALALERLIPRRAGAAKRTADAPSASRSPLPAPLTAAVAAPRESAVVDAEAQLPALEVPTMTFGTHVEESANGDGAKPAPRPRKSGSKSGSAAPRRRRSPAPRVAPTTDDAS